MATVMAHRRAIESDAVRMGATRRELNNRLFSRLRLRFDYYYYFAAFTRQQSSGAALPSRAGPSGRQLVLQGARTKESEREK